MQKAKTLIRHEPWQNQKNDCVPSEDSDQPGHPPSLNSVFAERMNRFGSLTTHSAHSEDSDQTGRMPRLIWVFAGRTLIALVLSCRGSHQTEGNKPFKLRNLRLSYLFRGWKMTTIGIRSYGIWSYLVISAEHKDCWPSVKWKGKIFLLRISDVLKYENA